MKLRKKQAQELPMMIPNYWKNLIFRFKALCFQLKRAWQNRFKFRVQTFLPKKIFQDDLSEDFILAESRTPLWPEQFDEREIELIAGKIHNLRRAATCFHQIEIPAGKVFSFWKQLGRLTKFKGYAKGREIREGCVIPTIGGGICQLSNALYDAALKAGLQIIERHGHTAIIPGSLAESNRDATVFWNYVDLRFRASHNFRLKVFLDEGQLKIQILGKKAPKHFSEPQLTKPLLKLEKNCYTCEKISCSRYVAADAKNHYARQAFLLDSYWPEYQEYINRHLKDQDLVLAPFSAHLFGRRGYSFNNKNLIKKYATLTALRRAMALRRLPAQGGALQKTLQRFDQAIAKKYLTQLGPKDLHLIISQNLLPYLWQSGQLGGRSFDVLMTRLPIKQLHSKLEQASQLYPKSKTLKDFRYSQEIIQAETAALHAATKLITPHPRIAELFPDKTERLEWSLPSSQLNWQRQGNAILFAAPTLGRKGAYEIRELAKHMDLELFYDAKNLELENFWEDVRAQAFHPDQLNQIAAVIAPSYVENQARYLFPYIVTKIPVIASAACGLDFIPGVKVFPTGDFEALKDEVSKIVT